MLIIIEVPERGRPETTIIGSFCIVFSLKIEQQASHLRRASVKRRLLPIRDSRVKPGEVVRLMRLL
jgi:hypothetical protein